MKKFFQNESGQGMVEYGLIIALVAVVAIAALSLMGPRLKGFFDHINGELDAAGAHT